MHLPGYCSAVLTTAVSLPQQRSCSCQQALLPPAHLPAQLCMGQQVVVSAQQHVHPLLVWHLRIQGDAQMPHKLTLQQPALLRLSAAGATMPCALAASRLELQRAVRVFLLLRKQPICHGSSTLRQPRHPQLPQHVHQLTAVHLNPSANAPQAQLPQTCGLPCGTHSVTGGPRSVTVAVGRVRGTFRQGGVPQTGQAPGKVHHLSEAGSREHLGQAAATNTKHRC
jgi:hypothetical protein